MTFRVCGSSRYHVLGFDCPVPSDGVSESPRHRINSLLRLPSFLSLERKLRLAAFQGARCMSSPVGDSDIR